MACLRCQKQKPNLFYGFCQECLNESANARKKAGKRWEKWWKKFYAEKYKL